MEKINKKKLLVFLDVSIDGDVFERMVFELFTDVAPKTAENFRALCTGEKGISTKTGKPLHYKGTFFHRIFKSYAAQGGDFLRQEGNFGESIYSGKFPDESPKLKHDGPGLLSMVIADRDERGSLFSITFKSEHHLDRKNIVFGKLVKGHEVLKKIENVGAEDGIPAVTVKIINSGELHDYKSKGDKLKIGKDTVEANNHEVKRKGKHKKSTKKRRKRRRHYTSESDSSSDTETESLESNSDSDMDASSFSDTSSSSDERRKKRKRNKRDRHRRGKGKDRRHEKRRKRRDKKSKHRSRRDSVSDSETDSKSGSSSEDNDAAIRASDKPKKSGNMSYLLEDREVASLENKKGTGEDMFEREEGEFPTENGEHNNNGAGVKMQFERARLPNVVDDLPSKSRSRSLSPTRAPCKSMSLSPRKIAGRIPSIGAMHDRSRSPSIDRNPLQIHNRSRSISPNGCGSSRSPIRSPLGRQTETSPIAPPPRSHSYSCDEDATVSPSRKRITRSPPRNSSEQSSLRSASRSPVGHSRRSLSSSGKHSRRSLSRSPIRSSHRSISRSSGRAAPRIGLSTSPVRAHIRTNRRSYSRSPISAGCRERSPISDRARSSSRSPSVDESPKRIRRGRGFSDRYSYVRRYRSRSRSSDRSPVRPYRYGGRIDRDRYTSFRKSPRRYRSPPHGRSPPRYRGRRSRTRSPISRSPIRYRNRRFSRSRTPVRSRSPVDRYRGSSHDGKRKIPSRSQSKSVSHQSPDSKSPKRASKGNSRSSSGSPPRKTGLVAYGDPSPDSGRD